MRKARGCKLRTLNDLNIWADRHITNIPRVSSRGMRMSSGLFFFERSLVQLEYVEERRVGLHDGSEQPLQALTA